MHEIHLKNKIKSMSPLALKVKKKKKRNGMDLTEVEILRISGKNTQKKTVPKKTLMTQITIMV